MSEPSEFDVFSGPLRAELEARASACRWSPVQRQIVADICDWQLMHPLHRPGYLDGQPSGSLEAIIRHVNEAARAREEDRFEAFRSAAQRRASPLPWQRHPTSGSYLVLRNWQTVMKKQPVKQAESKPMATVFSRKQILGSFGAAQSVLCDAIPTLRPKLVEPYGRSVPKL